MYTTIQPTQQLQLPIGVKEEILPQPRKRVAIVSVKLVQEALQLRTKAAQIIRMLDVKHPNPRQVAIKHGFETVDALGEYMASQGYYWCNESQNYQYEAQPSPSLSVPDTPPMMTPPPAPTPKTLTLARTMIALLKDFSTEYNLSQRMIVEGALIEYFQKYGYGERVQQAIH